MQELEGGMKKLLSGLLGAMISVMLCEPVLLGQHANRYGGGSTYHAQGSDSTTRTNGYGGEATHTAGQGTSYANKYGDTATHTEGSGTTTGQNAYGGSATHTAGQGTSASSAYGGSAYHAEGSGTTTGTGAYGGTATHYAGVGTVGTTSSGTTAYASEHYYGGTTAVYHPPVVVNSYSAGCYNCGGWSTAGAAAAGVVVGAVAGAAVASANSSAAASTAYAAGVAAGASYSMGEIVATIPAGCATPTVSGMTYYLCGNTWFQPSYGANGVYY